MQVNKARENFYRNVHSSRKSVIAALALVDVIVGMHGRLGAHSAAQQLNGTVTDDLVGVHVGLRAGAGLPNDEREVVVVELARYHLVSRLRYCVGYFCIKPVVFVDYRRRFLQYAHRYYYWILKEWLFTCHIRFSINLLF